MESEIEINNFSFKKKKEKKNQIIIYIYFNIIIIIIFVYLFVLNKTTKKNLLQTLSNHKGINELKSFLSGKMNHLNENLNINDNNILL